MILKFHKRFEKRYSKLSQKLQIKIDATLEIFQNNPHDPSLRNHALKGSLSDK